MKKVFIIGIFLFSCFQLFAQSPADSIEVKKGMGTVFRQNGRNLTPRQLLDITQSNPAAHQEMKAAKTNYDVGYVLGFAGGLFVGWPLGSAIAGGDPNWTLMGVGAGLIGLSVPFSTAYNKHAKNAARLYNGGSSPSGMNKVEFRFGMTGTGIGLNMAF
jgi:hypothetical protein